MVRIISSLILLVIAIFHNLYPSTFALDWRSVTLILVSFLIFLSPRFLPFLPLIKRLKLGEVEIELGDKVSELFKTVEKSEAELTFKSTNNEKQYTVSAVHCSDTSLESRIIEIASRDKGAALVQLNIEIEKELFELYEYVESKNISKSKNWTNVTKELRQQGIITENMEKSLLAFSNIKYNIIHDSINFTCSERVLNSILDSGIRLLRLLRNMPKQI